MSPPAPVTSVFLPWKNSLIMSLSILILKAGLNVGFEDEPDSTVKIIQKYWSRDGLHPDNISLFN